MYPTSDGNQMEPDQRAAIRGMLVDHVDKRVAFTSPRNPLLIGVAVVGVIIATSGFILLKPEPVTDITSVECLASAEVDAPSVHGVIGDTLDESGTVVRPGGVHHPVQMCAHIWAQGLLTPDGVVVPPPDEVSADHPVPPLTECVAAEGIAVVVPSDQPQICHDLGLAPVASS